MLVGCVNFPVSMAKYFKQFEAVEIDRTFYAMPRESTLIRWREMAPPGFTFSVKASRKLTHSGMDPSTEGGGEGLRATLWAAGVLGARYILFQTPPSLGPSSISKIREVLKTTSDAGYKVGYEARGESWKGHEDDLREALKGVASHVVDPFTSKELHSEGFHYFRLHGLGKTPYRYRYSDAELLSLKEIVKGVEGETLLVFNNTNAHEDAL